MTCLSGISGWAGMILESLQETGIPTGQVVTWLQNNLGTLNIAIDTYYEISGVSGCIYPDMNQSASGIYTEMYYCYYYQRKSQQNLGAMAYDSWTEIEGKDEGKIKRVSKNEIAKVYRSLYLDCKDNVKDLVKWYKDQSSAYYPRQTIYNSRIGVSDGGLRDVWQDYPPAAIFSSGNVVWQTY